MFSKKKSFFDILDEEGGLWKILLTIKLFTATPNDVSWKFWKSKIKGISLHLSRNTLFMNYRTMRFVKIWGVHFGTWNFGNKVLLVCTFNLFTYWLEILLRVGISLLLVLWKTRFFLVLIFFNMSHSTKMIKKFPVTSSP